MCVDGCCAFRGYPGPKRGWGAFKDDRCHCGKPRLTGDPSSFRVTAARTWYLMSVADVIQAWFADPKWYSTWKKGLDVSVNAFRSSPYAKKLNDGLTGLPPGEFLDWYSSICALTADGCIPHIRATKGITGVGIRCEDQPPDVVSSQSNWANVAAIGAPEPPNLGTVIFELLEELAVLAERGVMVQPGDGSEAFRLKVFVGAWIADSQGRRKIWMRGGPSNLKGCPWCRLSKAPMTVGSKTRSVPRGYLEPVRQIVTGAEEEEVKVGDDCLKVNHNDMVRQMGIVQQMQEEVTQSQQSGNKALKALNKQTLDYYKMFTGCSGYCHISRILPYVDLPNFFPVAPAHLTLHGILRNYYAAYLNELDQLGFKALKQHDARIQFVLLTSDYGRVLRPIIAECKKSKGVLPVCRRLTDVASERAGGSRFDGIRRELT